ncbi:MULTISPECIES: hypothetical protein [Vitreoscilla]|nr:MULTISPECIES: hypothetical protein [Vitreoscilla]
MKSLPVSRAFKTMVWCLVSGLVLSACADSSEVTAQAPSHSSQVTASASTPLSQVSEPNATQVSAEILSSSAVANIQTEESRNVSVREFNPADFPDACNDYIDEVLQCIKVMDQAGMEGTASMQMQLSEMQASWLNTSDSNALNQTCKLALLDVEPVLQDLGC